MVVYRIANWRENFENVRTSKFGIRLHIDICTKYGSYEIRHLLKHTDGGWHFTFWILLLEWHARTTSPREGWLTHNGKVDGVPLIPQDLHEELRIPVKYVKTALERLSTPPISWISVERSVDAAYTPPKDSVKAALLTQPNLTQPNPTVRAAHAQKLKWFDEFWTKEIWSDLRDKKKAREAWMKIPHLDQHLFEKIKAGALSYQDVRKELLATGGTPKMAQGWLNDQRWDDEAPPPQQAANKDTTIADRIGEVK